MRDAGSQPDIRSDYQCEAIPRSIKCVPGALANAAVRVTRPAQHKHHRRDIRVAQVRLGLQAMIVLAAGNPVHVFEAQRVDQPLLAIGLGNAAQQHQRLPGQGTQDTDLCVVLRHQSPGKLGVRRFTWQFVMTRGNVLHVIDAEKRRSALGGLSQFGSSKIFSGRCSRSGWVSQMSRSSEILRFAKKLSSTALHLRMRV